MDFRQLRAFNAVMESGLVSQAARKIGVTQPAISKIIKGLEEEAQVPLFVREKGRLKPTPEARYLQNIARNIFGQINDAKRFLRDYGSLKAGDLKILSIPGPTLFFLPNVISQFTKQNPRRKASLLSWSTPQVVNWIANHQSGIGLAEWFDPHPSLKLHPLSLRCVCAVPKHHRLAEKAIITPIDLEKEMLSSIISEHPLFRRIEDSFREAGCAMNVQFQSDLFVPSFTMIENSNMIGIVDPINARNYQLYRGNRAGIVFRSFEPEIHLRISVVTPAHEPLSHLANHFRDVLIKEMEALNSGRQWPALSN